MFCPKGYVTVEPEDDEDMWHLYNLIQEVCAAYGYYIILLLLTRTLCLLMCYRVTGFERVPIVAYRKFPQQVPSVQTACMSP